nr:MAG TPA: Reverse gyrase zinc finger [Caudoviricetes sp.]
MKCYMGSCDYCGGLPDSNRIMRAFAKQPFQ